MRNLPVSVVAVQGRLLESLQISQRLRRKNSRCRRWRHVRTHHGCLLRINPRSTQKQQKREKRDDPKLIRLRHPAIPATTFSSDSPGRITRSGGHVSLLNWISSSRSGLFAFSSKNLATAVEFFFSFGITSRLTLRNLRSLLSSDSFQTT